MTTIITRLYPNAKAADAVVTALVNTGQNRRSIAVIAKDADADARPLEERLAEAGVGADAIAPYAKGVTGGGVLVVAKAPLGSGGAALRSVRKFAAVDVGVKNEERIDGAGTAPGKSAADLVFASSAALNHKRYLTEDMNAPSARRYGLVFTAFGARPLSERRTRDSAVGKTGFVSTKYLSFPLLSAEKKRDSAVGKSGTPFSKALGLSLLSPRRG